MCNLSFLCVSNYYVYFFNMWTFLKLLSIFQISMRGTPAKGPPLSMKETLYIHERHTPN